jgi:hypothetical protein
MNAQKKNNLVGQLITRVALLMLGIGMIVAVTATVTAPVTPSLADDTDELAELNDEFEDPETLSEWTPFEETQDFPTMIKTLTIEDGNLYLEPYTSAWYADYYGTFVFKEVTGDFVVTTRIWAKGKEADVPEQYWSLTGLMARVPREITPETWKPSEENWVFITTGIADSLIETVFETKTTVNSQSTLELHPAPSGWVELRMARIGADFVMVYRADETEDWTLLAHFNRPDMPETLQVGINAYTDWYTGKSHAARPLRFNTEILTDETGKPDLNTLVDYIHFQRPTLPRDFDTASMSDNDWESLIAAQ